MLAACGLGFAMSLAIAQQGEVAKTSPKAATGEETSWVKICTKEGKGGEKQVCLVKHEGLEPKTGAVLIAAAVAARQRQMELAKEASGGTAETAGSPASGRTAATDQRQACVTRVGEIGTAG